MMKVSKEIAEKIVKRKFEEIHGRNKGEINIESFTSKDGKEYWRANFSLFTTNEKVQQYGPRPIYIDKDTGKALHLNFWEELDLIGGTKMVREEEVKKTKMNNRIYGLLGNL